MAKYVGRVVDGVLLWFESPRRLDQQKHDPHSACGQCNKKYTRKPGKKKSSSPSKAMPVVTKPAKEAVRGILTRACEGCNGKFTPPSGQGRHKLFCTVKCRTKVRNKKASEKILQKKREIRGLPRECQNCTKSFKVERSKGSLPKFCSASCREKHSSNKKTTTEKGLPKKAFVERVAKHLPTLTPPAPPVAEPVKDMPTSKVIIPTWKALSEEASEIGVDLDKETKKSQSFWLALLLSRRTTVYEQWVHLLDGAEVRIRRYPETFMAMRGVSNPGAVAAARGLKTRMNM